MADVYVEVFGCSANLADSEIASGLLREAGHSLVPSPEEADALLTITCTVKTPTELKMIKQLRKLAALGKPLIVAGCMPKAQKILVEQIVPSASLMGPDDLLRIVEVVEGSIDGKRIEALMGMPTTRTCLPRNRRNPVIHIAPISSGCLGDCSYCIVKRARGRLHSFPADEIVDDVRRAVEDGCREIWLTSEDTAAYRWKSIRLPQLLEKLIAVEESFYIRVGMMTPNQALPILEDLVKVYESEKIFKFLHVPVQSGDDDILRKMRRRYTVDEFLGLISQFRKKFQFLSLSTDIICGFPSETERQFMNSMKLVQKVQPDTLNISRFWPRSGTKAAEMEGQLHGRETKTRSRKLTKLWRQLSIDRGKRWVGWKGEILIDEFGKNETLLGRNYAYRPIVISAEADLGEFIEVRVTKAKVGYLLGQCV